MGMLLLPPSWTTTVTPTLLPVTTRVNTELSTVRSTTSAESLRPSRIWRRAAFRSSFWIREVHRYTSPSQIAVQRCTATLGCCAHAFAKRPKHSVHRQAVGRFGCDDHKRVHLRLISSSTSLFILKPRRAAAAKMINPFRGCSSLRLFTPSVRNNCKNSFIATANGVL